jgi:nucleotide-binding universal stress UspA family protein
MSTVLIPTDGSPAAEQAIGHAVTIAGHLDGTVHGLYAVHLTPNADYDLGVESPTVQEAEKERGKAALNTIERHCEAAGVNFEGHLRDGAPAETITTVAAEIDPDVIAMGIHGGGRLARPLLGSTTVEVLRQATHPVLAVPDESTVPTGGYDTLLVATDASDGARDAEQTAFEWADAFDGSIEGLYVVELGLSDTEAIEEALEADGEQAVDELHKRAQEVGVDAGTAVETGVPHDVISDHADEQDADLIVLGARGRGTLERTFLGSVSERTVRTADRPVLVV